MVRKLRELSGREIIKIFETFGFSVVNQVGSHVKLRRESIAGAEMLIVPAHPNLPRGTVRDIFKQACRFIPNDDLYPHCHTSDS